jgi:hypothetical protein
MRCGSVVHMFESALCCELTALMLTRCACITMRMRIHTLTDRDVGWSIISTDFSADEKWLAYSSWSQFVHLCNVQGDYEVLVTRHE